MPKERHHHHHHYYGEDTNQRDRYAYHAGEPGPGPNRHRIYRNIRKGKVAGVCAGFADYFGWNLKYVRLGLIIATIMAFPLPAVLYGIAAFVLKPGENLSMQYASPEEERFWRTYSVKPKATFSELKHRFRALDSRIGDMEQAVTSSEFGLRKEFRDLEGGL